MSRFARLSPPCLATFALLALALPAPPSRAAGPRDLVIISLDTVRRDHLGVYGYERATSPAIDRFARAGVIFDNAFTQDVNTNPSHASMFTGVYPHVHGSTFNGIRLAPEQLTLARILADAGYRTAGFVSGAPMTDEACALGRGFQHYDDQLGGPRRAAGATLDRALEWVSAPRKERPRFLFLHLYDAHGPYDAGSRLEQFRSKSPGKPLRLAEIPAYQRSELADEAVALDLAHYVDRYDASIRVMDAAVAALLEALDLSRTVVLILSDHGETLGERAWKLDHGAQLFDEQMRIPLILRAPGLQARRVRGAVETVDLLPTILELLGVDRPVERPVQGHSLLPLITDPELPGRRFTLAGGRAVTQRHADRGFVLDGTARIHAVRGIRFKLIRYPGYFRPPYVELYDLRTDPAERSDIAAEQPETRDALLKLLDDRLGDARTPPAPGSIDPELRKQLESLGYTGN